MTAEQIRLVRDLRSFESPVCMEAAREIERQAEALKEKNAQVDILETHVAYLENTISGMVKESQEDQKSLQYYMERDHGGSL